MSAANPGDRELEQLLAETAGLKQRYRASSQDEPPAAIDNAIRAAARREVRARPRLAGSPFSGSWRIPISIAAVLVVSATVTILIVERDAHLPAAGNGSVPAPAVQPPTSQFPLTQSPLPLGQNEPIPARQRLEQRTDARASEAAAKARIEAPESSALSGTTTGVKLEKHAKSAPHEEKASEPEIAEPTIRDGAMPEAKIPEAETSAPLTASEYQQHLFPAQTRPTPAAAGNAAPQPTPAGPTDAGTLPSDVAAGPASTKPRASSPLSREGTVREAEPERDAAQESPGERAAAKKGAASVREAPASSAAAPVPQAPAKRFAGAATDSAVAAQEDTRARHLAKEEAARAMLSSEAPAAPWERDPKAWLKHIDDLRTAGLVDDAKASFKTFRSRYPDYPLPAGFLIPGA